MSARRLKIHPAGLAVVLFGFIVWVIALGGIGATTYDCRQDNSDSTCAKSYQWEWWSLWFEFFLLVALFISGFLDSYYKGRHVFTSYYLIATFCLMISAHNFLLVSMDGVLALNVKNVKQDAYTAAAAGFVMLSITNFALLIVLGLAEDPNSSYQTFQNSNQPAIQFSSNSNV